MIPRIFRLDWETYNTVPVDATLVDLNFFVGDAFPLKGSLKAESNGTKITSLAR